MLAAAPVNAAADVQGLPKGTLGAREVMLVANAEGGTVSIVDARRLRVLREIDILPDGEEPGLTDNPTQALLGQQVVEAAGGKNYAQDQDVSPDGRTLYVSRGHRGDVAAFDIRSGKLIWKVAIPGVRSDHMTISDDGRFLYVSALTEDEVEVIDTGATRDRRELPVRTVAARQPREPRRRAPVQRQHREHRRPGGGAPGRGGR